MTIENALRSETLARTGSVRRTGRRFDDDGAMRFQLRDDLAQRLRRVIDGTAIRA